MGGCTVCKGGAVVMEAKLDKGIYLVPVCVPQMERAHGVEAEEAACSTRWRDMEEVAADLLHLRIGHAGRHISLCQCIQEGVWLKHLFGEFGHEFAGGVPVFVDNQSAIALAQNACLHGRTKHMQARWHFIREMVAGGVVILRWCQTNSQAADILTKPLPFERHGVCMSLLGMHPHVGMVPEQDVGGLVLLSLDNIMQWMAPLLGQGGVE
ncbi:unnamed protein product [Closterium sp. NIES-53]